MPQEGMVTSSGPGQAGGQLAPKKRRVSEASWMVGSYAEKDGAYRPERDPPAKKAKKADKPGKPKARGGAPKKQAAAKKK